MAAASEITPFDRLGSWPPALPVVLAIPHAGRHYPQALIAAAAVAVHRLEALEDRFADRLAIDAIAGGTTAIIARPARAWIDLNRHEREIDPAMIEPSPDPAALIASAKVRGGLGLLPRRISGAGDIYRRRLTPDDVAARIALCHRPYHVAIAEALDMARARFGVAILLDCHSMPPLPPGSGDAPARLVIGDRFGQSAAGRFVERLAITAEGAGLATAHNVPYAGGHTLDRHGAPRKNIHAIQIEIDRSLYLQPDLRTAAPEIGRISAILASLVTTLVNEALPAPSILAAE